jgi:hypothetical protein
MKYKRFSEEQIIGVLKEHEAGGRGDELCRRHAISTATFYTSRKKYGGIPADLAPWSAFDLNWAPSRGARNEGEPFQ